MASAPQPQLPLFYRQLEPLSSQLHGDFKVRRSEVAPFVAQQHAVPVTVDEFALVGRRMPIIFSVGDDPVPLGLMSLNEGSNTFFDEEGRWIDPDAYVPAYIRRYPFMLARLRPDSQEMSLCFDPTADTIGAFDEGEPLFTGDQPSEATRSILEFNEQFEQAGQRTQAFMAELKQLDLLTDGEVTITPEGSAPFVYRGFLMVNEDKVKALRGDQLRKMAQSGLLPLLYAHLFSVSLMRDIFGRQQRQNKLPQQPLVLNTPAPLNG
jgi:hypothetical protein